MAEFRFTSGTLRIGVKLPVGTGHVITVMPVGPSLVRLLGMFFDLDKCFLLPSVMGGIREIKNMYDAHPGSRLLLVGHTDTSGNESSNLDLSLERADSVSAFLRDQVSAWEKFFNPQSNPKKQWGMREIQFMLSALPEGKAPFYGTDPTGVLDGPTEAAVREFQTFTGLEVDGIAGEKTRKALITAYMSLDGTSLPTGIELQAHGCGESFPHDLSDAALNDPAVRAQETKDGVRRDEDRRVEVFFFDEPIIPTPSPSRKSGKSATDYPQWRKQVVETRDISLLDSVVRDTPLPVAKARLPLVFRRNKTFPDPTNFALLRDIAKRMADDADLFAVIIGHADSFGQVEENDSLSKGRADAVAAMLSNDAAFLEARFGDGSAASDWNSLEAAEMIGAIQEPDGFPVILKEGENEITTFQASKGLAPSGDLDRATRAALALEYPAALGIAPIDASKLRTAGAGSVLAPQPMGDGEAVSEEPDSLDFVDRRRAEVFLFEGKDSDKVDKILADARGLPSTVKTWCQAQAVVLDSPTGPLRIRFDDGAGKALANARISLHKGKEDQIVGAALAVATTDGQGIAQFTAEPGPFTVAIGTAEDRESALVRVRKRFPNRITATLFSSSGV